MATPQFILESAHHFHQVGQQSNLKKNIYIFFMVQLFVNDMINMEH